MAGARDADIALSRRGWSLAGAAVGLACGSVLLGSREMRILALASILILAASHIRVLCTQPPSVEVHREIRPNRLHVGSEGRIDVVVENRTGKSSPLLWATDSFDEGRRAARFLVPPLPPGGVARAAYRIPTRRRGRYHVGPLQVGASEPFGLARRIWVGTADAEVLVRPRIHDLVAPVAAGSRIAAVSESPNARSIASDLGDDFLALRDYEVGDDLRRVHWRSTARRGELMVRQDEARWRSRAAVVLDVCEDAHDDASFEVAVEAVASIVARLVRLRRHVEVVTGDGTVLGTGGATRHDVIDRLATIEPAPGDGPATVLTSLRTHRRVDLVIAVLGTVDQSTRRALGTLHGIQTIAVTTRGGGLESGSGMTVVDASVVDFATAWNRTFSRWSFARA